MAGVTRLHIDWTRCEGRGPCAELLPELLERDDWGYPLVRAGSRRPSRDPEVPVNMEKYAKAAVKRCPGLALNLLEPPESRPAG